MLLINDKAGDLLLRLKGLSLVYIRII